MKTIKCTHIDTGGHGYLSVSKKDFLEVCTPFEASGYSGHSLNRMYLEEDEDATKFLNKAEEMGYKVSIKSGYNLKFKITHNYSPDLFTWKPVQGQRIVLADDMVYEVVSVINQKFIIVSNAIARYKISLSNPFQYIKAVA